MGDSPLEAKDLVVWAAQLTRGMQCLAANGITHRALACQNVLVFHNRVLKIAMLGRLVVNGDDDDDEDHDDVNGDHGEATANGSCGGVPRAAMLANCTALGVPQDVVRWMVS